MSYKLHCGVFAVFRAVCTVFSTWLRDYPEDFRSLNDPSCLLRLAPLLPTDTSGAEIKGRLLRITEELSEKTLLSGSLSGICSLYLQNSPLVLLLVTLQDTFESVNSPCDLQAHQTWWKWCKDTKDTMLGICFMCHQSASLFCSSSTDKKYEIIIQKQKLYTNLFQSTHYYYKVQNTGSQHTWHDDALSLSGWHDCAWTVV